MGQHTLISKPPSIRNSFGSLNAHCLNMKTAIVLAALVACAVAAVPSRRQAAPFFRHQAPSVRHQAPSVAVLPAAQHYQAPAGSSGTYVLRETALDNIGVDGYRYGYELSDGTSRDESAQIETRGPEDAVLRVQGSYKYVDPSDGQTYTITYIADENGFQPQGAHLPVAPQV